MCRLIQFGLTHCSVLHTVHMDANGLVRDDVFDPFAPVWFLCCGDSDNNRIYFAVTEDDETNDLIGVGLTRNIGRATGVVYQASDCACRLCPADDDITHSAIRLYLRKMGMHNVQEAVLPVG